MGVGPGAIDNKIVDLEKGSRENCASESLRTAKSKAPTSVPCMQSYRGPAISIVPSRTSRRVAGPRSPGGSRAARFAGKAGPPAPGACRASRFSGTKSEPSNTASPGSHLRTSTGTRMTASSMRNAEPVFAIHRRDAGVQPPHADRHHGPRPRGRRDIPAGAECTGIRSSFRIRGMRASTPPGSRWT